MINRCVWDYLWLFLYLITCVCFGDCNLPDWSISLSTNANFVSQKTQIIHLSKIFRRYLTFMQYFFLLLQIFLWIVIYFHTTLFQSHIYSAMVFQFYHIQLFFYFCVYFCDEWRIGFLYLKDRRVSINSIPKYIFDINLCIFYPHSPKTLS